MKLRARAPSPITADVSDAGFTLIELLVVIIIIGILAAIALPIYMNQRTQGFDASAKADLNHVAQFEESYLVDALKYGSFTDMQTAGQTITHSPNVTLTVTYNGAVGYCIVAKHAQSPNTWYYDSQGGGLQAKGATGCPVTTSGTAGGSIGP